MKKTLFYLVSFVLTSVLLISCDKENSDEPKVDGEIIQPSGFVSKIMVNTIENENSTSVDMSFTYDKQGRLVKLTNFYNRNLEYQYNTNSITIKSMDKDDPETYYNYKCSIENELIKEITFKSFGFDNEIIGKFSLTYGSDKHLLRSLIESPNNKTENYIWNEAGNCTKIERTGYPSFNFKSLGILNTANIDFSSIIGGFPNNIDLQMIALIKKLGLPNKDIMADSDLREYAIKTDAQNRLIEATKKYDNKTVEYTIYYNE